MKKIYFSTNLKHLRESKGWKQSELADKLGVTEQVISHWENDRREPNNMEMVGRIAELFNVNEDILFKDLRIEENVKLDETHFADRIIMDNLKTLSEEEKQKIISIMEIIKGSDNSL